MGILEKIQVEYVLVIDCLHKKKNNQKCFTSHKVFNLPTSMCTHPISMLNSCDIMLPGALRG